jgi:hypothetical protein
MERVPQKLINLGLILSFLICYMEWGGGNSAFVARVEYDLLFRRMDPSNFGHPLILAPFAGQILLLITLFQRSPGRKLTLAGILLMGTLVLMLILVSVLARNLLMAASVLPFVVFAMLHFAKRRASR